MHGNIRAVRSIDAIISNNKYFLPEFKELYLHERSFTGSNYISPVFSAMPLINHGFELFLELDANNHSYQAMLSLMLGANLHDIENIVIYENNMNDFDLTLSLIDDWHKQAEDFSLESINNTESLADQTHLFFNSDYEVFNFNDEIFEKLHMAGIEGIFLPENYDPVKLMNVFNLADEYGLQVFNSASIYSSTRQLKFAIDIVPQLDMPADFIQRMEDSKNKLEEGLQYFKEYIDFTKNFEAKGVIIENPTKKILQALKKSDIVA
jgi:hypothetical protein